MVATPLPPPALPETSTYASGGWCLPCRRLPDATQVSAGGCRPLLCSYADLIPPFPSFPGPRYSAPPPPPPSPPPSGPFRFGKTLIVTEVDKVEPMLYPILRNDLMSAGPKKTVQVGDKQIDWQVHCVCLGGGGGRDVLERPGKASFQFGEGGQQSPWGVIPPPPIWVNQQVPQNNQLGNFHGLWCGDWSGWGHFLRVRAGLGRLPIPTLTLRVTRGTEVGGRLVGTLYTHAFDRSSNMRWTCSASRTFGW